MTEQELKTAQAINRAKWAAHNDRIIAAPRGGFERAIAWHWKALADYAKEHQKRYESPIGDDAILGEHWKQSALAFLGFLNGDCGRFDCGDLDGRVRVLADSSGVDLES